MSERLSPPFLRATLAVAVLAWLSLAGTGCGGKAPQTIPEPAGGSGAEPARPESRPRPAEPSEPVEVKPDYPTEQPFEEEQLSVEEINRQRPLETVYFAYDRDDLSEEARFKLRRSAEWLRRHESYSVRVEGHCDERGTIEYNLALGQRRARSVREYLISLGVPAERMRVVSYGEERPACPGSNEEAWQCNRRAEFLVE